MDTLHQPPSGIVAVDVVDGGILGMVVTCHECSGAGTLHRPYRLPDGSFVDVFRGFPGMELGGAVALAEDADSDETPTA